MLSVIVVFYNMHREAPRTLFALSVEYQRGMSVDDYEIIAVDNGSDVPLSADLVRSYGLNFRHIRIDDASPSPTFAVNTGIRAAKGDLICVMIDGARIPSPGLLAQSIAASRLAGRVVVTCPSLDLGPDMQLRSSRQGYGPEAEDRLLENCDWRRNGYLLYGISALNSSCDFGIFARIAETNALVMPSSLFEEIGGYDEAFDIPGGGLVNHDAMIRAAASHNTTLVRLIGEATFHQIHHGSGSARPLDEALILFRQWREHYEAIRGRKFGKLAVSPIFFGKIPPEALPLIAKSAALAQDRWNVASMLKGADNAAMAVDFTDFNLQGPSSE